MSRYALALCVAVALAASGARADESEVLVPEGEPESILTSATWERMVGEVSICLVFSPTGRFLATGGDDGVVRVWDVSSGRLWRMLVGPVNVLSLAFSPDERLLAAGFEDGIVRWWELSTGAERPSLAWSEPKEEQAQLTERVLSLAFSPDGQLLAAGGDAGKIQLWDAGTGSRKTPLRGDRSDVLALAFSPRKGTALLASAGSDGQVRLWDVALAREVRPPLRGHRSAVQTLAFSPDGRFLTSGSTSGSVWWWEVEGQHEPQSVKNGHSSSVQAVAFSPDGRVLLSTGIDKTALGTAMTFPHLTQLRETLDTPFPVQAAAISPDGRTVAWSLKDESVRLWDVASAHEVRRLEAPASPVWTVAFSQDGTTLAAGGDDGLRLWRRGTRYEPQRLGSPETSVRSVAFTDGGRTLASIEYDSKALVWTAAMWNTSGSRLPDVASSREHPLRTVAFNKDGSVYALAGDAPKIWLENVAPGKECPSLESRIGPVSSLAFHPERPFLAAGGRDGVQLWDIHTGKELKALMKSHTKPVLAVAFSPDGNLLASAGEDDTVRLWDVKTWSELRPALSAHTGSVRAIAFHPGGRLLALGGSDGTIRLWEFVTRSEPLTTLRGHTSSVEALAFSPDGTTLASAGSDGAIRLWDPLKDKAHLGLLRAGKVGWLSHLRGEPVFRHDAEGLLLYRLGERGELQALPPPEPSAPKLHLEGAPAIEVGDFGQEVELTVTVSNEDGAGPAYWLRVELDEPHPGLMVLPRDIIPRLAPGERGRKLRVGLSYLRPDGTDEQAQASREPWIRLKAVAVTGDSSTVSQQLVLLFPQLTQEGAPEPSIYQRALLRTPFKNVGTQATDLVTGFVEFSDLPGEQHAQIAKSLAPGDTGEFLVLLPERLRDRDELAFQLTLTYGRWPHTQTFPPTKVKARLEYGLYVALILGAFLLFGFVYYARVYRNPMVVDTSRAPTSLKNYPLAHMVAADHALRRARRLDSTITAAGIPSTRWQRALCGAKGPQDAATAFADAIGGRLGASLSSSTWALSLPHLQLRFARETAVVVIDGTRLESGDAERRMADVFQDGRGPGQVLVLDRTNAQNARQVLEGVPRVRCVVLSANQLRDLLLAEEPVRLLETTISEQISVSELSPYQVAGGVKLENLFFGREREVRAIADRSVRNFLVVGQRQMGKSSLLLAVLRRLQARTDLDACYVELADADLHRRLARERERVPADGLTLPPFVEIAAGVPSRPRVWLIDEADDFISADAKAGYPLLQTMRALAEEGRAYFILAGFWDLYRAVVLDEKQPLRNFGEHLRLEPLDARSALALVTEPMAALSLEWDTPSTPEFLVEQAGRRANLLVLACKALVESLPPETHALTREHLERALREDKDLRDQGRRWRGDHPLHRAVVRQALLLGKPTREEVRQALKARGADIRSSDFDEAMDHRELSYVLVPDGEGHLYCPVPLMQRYIESERGLEVGLTEDLEDLRRRGLAEVPRPA